jgi:hypothetical protein
MKTKPIYIRSVFQPLFLCTPTDLSYVPPYFPYIYISYYLLTNKLTVLHVTANIY